jgi:hypothetical protein
VRSVRAHSLVLHVCDVSRTALTLLLGSGEGSLGQLQRRFGPAGCDALLRTLKVVWVSHMHADHHLGLSAILARRARVCSDEGVTIVGPSRLWEWLTSFERASGDAFGFGFVALRDPTAEAVVRVRCALLMSPRVGLMLPLSAAEGAAGGAANHGAEEHSRHPLHRGARACPGDGRAALQVRLLGRYTALLGIALARACSHATPSFGRPAAGAGGGWPGL